MRKGLAIAAMAVLGVVAGAQEKEDRTLLSPEQMNAIINEASGVLYVDPAGTAKALGAVEASVDKTGAALIDSVRAAYALHAQRLRTQPVFDPPQTGDERDAWNLIVERAPAAPGGRGAGGGGRGAGGGRGGASGPSLPQHMNAEFNILLGKNLSALGNSRLPLR